MTILHADYEDIVIYPGLTAQIRDGKTTYLSTSGPMTQEQKDALLAFEQKRAAQLGYVPPDPPIALILKDDYARRGLTWKDPKTGKLEDPRVPKAKAVEPSTTAPKGKN